MQAQNVRLDKLEQGADEYKMRTDDLVKRMNEIDIRMNGSMSRMKEDRDEFGLTRGCAECWGVSRQPHASGCRRRFADLLNGRQGWRTRTSRRT